MQEPKVKYKNIFFFLVILGMVMLSMLILNRVYVHFSFNPQKANEVLHLSKQELSEYNPETNWFHADTTDIIRLPNKVELRLIQKAYLEAWNALNISIHESNITLLSDYFGVNLLPQLIDNLSSEHKFIYEQLDLTHNIELHQLSLDRSFVAFTDCNIRVLRRIATKNTKEAFSQTQDTLAIQVIMEFKDGRYRITQWVPTPTVNCKPTPIIPSSFSINALNAAQTIYFDPKWKDDVFWSQRDGNIEHALDLLTNAQFNTLIVPLSYTALGGQFPSDTTLYRFEQLHTMAAARQLKLMFQLFNNVQDIDYQQINKHRHFIKQYALTNKLSNKAFLLDPPLEELIHTFGKEKTQTWLKLMTEHLHTYFSTSAIGVRNEILAQFPDLQKEVQFNLKACPEQVSNRNQADDHLPLLYDCSGTTSWNAKLYPNGGSDFAQYQYLKNLLAAKAKADLIYCHFSDREQPSRLRHILDYGKLRSRYTDGLVDINGKEKPALLAFLGKTYEARNIWDKYPNLDFYLLMLCLFLIISTYIYFKLEKK